jgi:hypothetical protein
VHADAVRTVGPFLSLGVITYGLWLAAAVCVLFDQGRAGRRFTALAALAAALTPIAAPAVGRERPPLYLLLMLVILSLLASGTLLSLRRSSRLALGGGLVLLTGLLLTIGGVWRSHESDPRLIFYRGWQQGLFSIALAAPVLVLAMLVAAALRSRRRRGWMAPAAVVSIPWLFLWLLFFPGHLGRYRTPRYC